MIIVKLMGGMGNQMFQYALGRHLSEKHGVSLKMDLSYLNKKSYHAEETVRNYELGIFNIKQAFASEDEIAKFMLDKPKKLLPKIFFQIKRAIKPRKNLRENFFHFDPNVFAVRPTLYLDGFWQSYKYFQNIEGIIRHEFSFKNNPEGNILKLYQKIKSLNSVSIHVRRGDYVAFKSVNAYHGVCSLEYYNQAISLISQKVANPHFFVFSDEIAWAKENLKINAPHLFVENSTTVPAYEDLRLMSVCKHHIIANSSFSWWAAWLNDSKEKVVVAPVKWFNEKSKDTKDFIPNDWMRI